MEDVNYGEIDPNHIVDIKTVQSSAIKVLVEALKEKGKANKKSVTQIYVIPIKTLNESLKIVKQLRDAGVNTDVDLMNRGISKCLSYANSYEIPNVLFIGQRELDDGKFTLRDMKTGKEDKFEIKDIIKKLK